MTTEQAEKYWALISEEAGSPEHLHDDFISHMTEPNLSGFPREFRFEGMLGFGGKAHFSNGHAYVSCYAEDSIPQRVSIIESINEQLRVLFGNAIGFPL